MPDDQPFTGAGILILMTVYLAMMLGLIALFLKRYVRVPPNRALVVYGKSGGGRTAKVLHGGAAFVFPVVQDYAFLSLEPLEIRLPDGTPRLIRIDTEPAALQAAAEQLLGLREEEITSLATRHVEQQQRRPAEDALADLGLRLVGEL